MTPEPFTPWSQLREHVRSRDGRPISQMTLHRWAQRGLITTYNIAGRRYIKLTETLARLAERDRAAN